MLMVVELKHTKRKIVGFASLPSFVAVLSVWVSVLGMRLRKTLLEPDPSLNFCGVRE